MVQTPGVLNNCLSYFVLLDENLAPIPSTMKAKTNAKLDVDYSPCNEALLPPVQMTAPAGTVNCLFPNGLRYWYKVNTLTGKILPNSMVSSSIRPNNLCSGTYSLLEYKRFAPLGSI